MRDTLFVHNNCIYLSVFTNYAVDYYARISKYNIKYIQDDYDRFYIKLNQYINDALHLNIYKYNISVDEIQDFEDWCKLNNIKIENMVQQ